MEKIYRKFDKIFIDKLLKIIYDKGEASMKKAKAKSIIKEIFILTLILIAIALILAIILYNYSPSKKALPNKVEYSTPDNISQEIGSMDDIEGTTPVTITYELDETNIKNSKKSGSYNSGKQNPFADVEKPEENTKDGESGDTKDTNTSTNSTTSTSNSSSKENSSNSTTNNTTSYLPQTGTK